MVLLFASTKIEKFSFSRKVANLVKFFFRGEENGMIRE